jgi:DNA-binding NtrC family response regulator
LAEHFLRELAPSGQVVKLTEEAVAKLEQHDWPGNIRELRNVVQSALLLCRGRRVEAGDISFGASTSARVPEVPVRPSPLELPAGVTLEQMLGQVERQLIESTLKRCDHHKGRAAKALGLARSSLFKKLREWGLGPEGD